MDEETVPPPTPLHYDISCVLSGELSALGAKAATFTCEVADDAAAGMYLTEVEPTRPGAASLSLGYDGSGGGDTLHVTFGNTSFELFPFHELDLGYCVNWSGPS